MELTPDQKFNWILLRGLAREVRHWGDFPTFLEEAPTTNKVFCLEIPGIGKKSNQTPPLSISAYVDQLRPEFLEIQKNESGPWGIIGISMGGMMGMDWVHRFSQDFKKIVLINSSAKNICTPLERFSLTSVQEIGQLLFKSNIRERERAILKLTTNMISISGPFLDYRESIAGQYPLQKKTFFKQIFAASQFKAPLKLPIPALVLRGLKDKLASPSCSQKLAKQYQALLKTHEQAGHDLPLDDPGWTTKQIDSFASPVSE